MKGIKQVKNYRLLKEIGRGQIGIVYEAVDDTNGKKYAIKSIPSSKLDNKRVLEIFKKELKMIHSLNHNNILKIIGLEKTVNNTYLVLEYCNGGSLKDYISFYHQKYSNLLPESHIQFFIRQLTQGTEYMMKNKLLKRDLKSENLLLNFASIQNIYKPQESNIKLDLTSLDIFDSCIKIGDVGYSKELDLEMKNSTKCGNPANITQIGIESHYNNHIELWSLGAITYELLFGLQPNYDKVLRCKDIFPEKFKISLEIISFINCLLNFNSDKRLSWDKITNHPFVVNNINTFTLTEVEKVFVEDSYNLEERKDEVNNFLWISLKSNLVKGLDDIMNNKLEENVNGREKIMICNDKEGNIESVLEKTEKECPKKPIQNNIKYDHKGDIGLVINTIVEPESSNHVVSNLNEETNTENFDRIEEKNKKLDCSPYPGSMTNFTPLNENNFNQNKELNDEVNMEYQTKNLNQVLEKNVLKNSENLHIKDKNNAHESTEIKKLLEENNSKHKIEISEFSEKKNLNDEIKNTIENQPTNVDMILEKDNKLSHVTGKNLEIANIKSEIRNKESIPCICITKESKYLKEKYLLNEISKEQLNTFKDMIEEEKRTSECMNKENEIKIEVAKDLEFKQNIEDKDKILKELLNQNFPYSETDVSNQRKAVIQENEVKNEETEDEDLWEIISSKSVDNIVNINIEVEGGLKDNLIILDYFK
jgi:serine/threonine protein kinase